jgi:hypothetical protein
LAAKRLELLRELAPGRRRLGNTSQRRLPSGQRSVQGDAGKPSPASITAKGTIRSKRYQRLYADLSLELGELNAIDSALLSQAVSLMCRAEREKSSTDAVRCTNTVSRLLASLRDKKRKHERPTIPLREQLRLEAEQA